MVCRISRLRTLAHSKELGPSLRFPLISAETTFRPDEEGGGHDSALRGADIVARPGAARPTDVFTLSGNHIMSIFDAAIEAKLS